jgi:hypothetical protein
MALAYADTRVYQTRLDRLAGPEGWSVEYQPIGERAVLCRLTILGVVREDVGEYASAGDENAWTSATMQAFKRAWAATSTICPSPGLTTKPAANSSKTRAAPRG